MTAHEHFNMDDFVGQFQTALQVTSPKKRMFLLDWMGGESAAQTSPAAVWHVLCTEWAEQAEQWCV